MTRAGRVELATGVRLPYVEQGDPESLPVLLLHAVGESAGVFSRLMPLLPPQMRVVAPDLRGHGAADAPLDGYHLRDSAADVVAFLDALEVEAAVLVGTSSGGYVAQQVALDHPRRVKGLVLVGSPRSLHGPNPFAELLADLADPVPESFVRAFMAMIPVHHPIPHDYFDALVRDGTRVPAHVWRAGMAGLTAATPPTELGVIHAPTVVIWGGRDDLLPAGDGVALAAAIPGAELVVYEGVGHLVLCEQPERVARDVVAMTARLDRSV